MGYARWRPKRLAEKLRHIRLTLNFSQSAFLNHLGFEGEIAYNRISDYECGKTDPPLIVLVEYARVAGVHVEAIIDDRLDLPKPLPDAITYEAWNSPRPKRTKTN